MKKKLVYKPPTVKSESFCHFRGWFVISNTPNPSQECQTKPIRTFREGTILTIPMLGLSGERPYLPFTREQHTPHPTRACVHACARALKSFKELKSFSYIKLREKLSSFNTPSIKKPAKNTGEGGVLFRHFSLMANSWRTA